MRDAEIKELIDKLDSADLFIRGILNAKNSELDEYRRCGLLDVVVLCDKVARLLSGDGGFVEVKHGEWIDTGDEILDTIYSGWKCSECGYIFCGNKFKFCPECGAKMDGGKEE